MPQTRREHVGEITWSYSRRGLFEQCPRRYYYTYFGSAARKSLAEPEKATLRRLKALQNRHERGGGLLHLAISTYFRRVQEGALMTSDQLVNWVLSIFHRDIVYSASDPDGQNSPRGQYPPVLLCEYHYRQGNVASLVADTEQRLVAAVRTFMSASVFDEFRRAGRHPGAFVEHRLRLPASWYARLTGDLILHTRRLGKLRSSIGKWESVMAVELRASN